MESEIKIFWQTHPCGAELVGDLTDESRIEYEDFFRRYDDFRYAKERHILKNLDRIDLPANEFLRSVSDRELMPSRSSNTEEFTTASILRKNR